VGNLVKVVVFWRDGQYEVHLPAVPRVGDTIIDGDGKGRVIDVEWNLEHPENPTIGIIVDDIEK
jgi:hypothetical protein